MKKSGIKLGILVAGIITGLIISFIIGTVSDEIDYYQRGKIDPVQIGEFLTDSEKATVEDKLRYTNQYNNDVIITLLKDDFTPICELIVKDGNWVVTAIKGRKQIIVNSETDLDLLTVEEYSIIFFPETDGKLIESVIEFNGNYTVLRGM